MPATTPFPLTPRQEGEPVAELLGMRLAHRVMVSDAQRLAAVAEQLASGATTAGGRRAVALDRYVRDWADCVEHHHTVEDELLWPVVVGSAGPYVDLSELTDDHAALAPALDRLRTASAAHAVQPGRDAARALAEVLSELRDALTEHVAEEEAAAFPVLTRHVSVRDWEQVEKRIRARATLSFELPRVRAVTSEQEWPVLVGRAGPVLRLLMAVVGPSFRRRERLVFGC